MAWLGLPCVVCVWKREGRALEGPFPEPEGCGSSVPRDTRSGSGAAAPSRGGSRRCSSGWRGYSGEEALAKQELKPAELCLDLILQAEGEASIPVL